MRLFGCSFINCGEQGVWARRQPSDREREAVWLPVNRESKLALEPAFEKDHGNGYGGRVMEEGSVRRSDKKRRKKRKKGKGKGGKSKKRG